MQLAGAVQTFTDRIPRVLTEKEGIAARVRLAVKKYFRTFDQYIYGSK